MAKIVIGYQESHFQNKEASNWVNPA